MPATDPARDAAPDAAPPARPAPGPDAPHHPVPRRQEPLWRDVLGEQLRALRHARGETLAETAGRAGVSPQYLSEVERGVKEPSSEMIAALAGALGTTLVDLTAGVVERLKERSAVPAGPSRMVGQSSLAEQPARGRNRIHASLRVGVPARSRSRRRGPHAATACLSSMTRSMSPYSLAASAVKTRSWSVSARSRSMVWLVCRERMRSISARTRTTSSA
jgi:Predicted transcriptional regulators